jgi:hypothetical protein
MSLKAVRPNMSRVETRKILIKQELKQKEDRLNQRKSIF